MMKSCASALNGLACGQIRTLFNSALAVAPRVKQWRLRVQAQAARCARIVQTAGIGLETPSP